jgi:excisionase family DNA binding protein
MESSQSQAIRQKNTDKWLTTAQVMELLDISRGTLYRLMSEGRLEPVKFTGNKILKHRRIRFSSESVEKIMIEFDYDCSLNIILP